MRTLANKVAIVTGANAGVGRAAAELLAREGASVAVCDLDEGPAREVAGPLGEAALAVACDVTRREEVESAVGRAVEAFGRLDILVCCAGITRDNLIHKMTDEDWQSVMATHLTGSFLACQAAQRVMVTQRYGKIVLLSSTSALGNRGQVNYSAAKAGLQGMARTLAIELGPFNINVNAVAPGFVETRMTEATARRLGVEWEEFKRQALERTPLRRLGQPADIAAVVSFLAGPDGAWVNGQVLRANGGII
jgi:3-oxoacyl-[acyl-carrier protein] reductase